MPRAAKTHLRDMADKGLRRRSPVATSERSNAQRFRDSGRWKKFRAWFVKRHPTCCDPMGLHPEQTVATEQVHHIKPLATHPELGCVEANCAPTCDLCHHKIEAIERAGRPTEQYFDQGEGGSNL